MRSEQSDCILGSGNRQVMSMFFENRSASQFLWQNRLEYRGFSVINKNGKTFFTSLHSSPYPLNLLLDGSHFLEIIRQLQNSHPSWRAVALSGGWWNTENICMWIYECDIEQAVQTLSSNINELLLKQFTHAFRRCLMWWKRESSRDCIAHCYWLTCLFLLDAVFRSD